MDYFKHLKVFLRMDALIRRKATGTPQEFARKLSVSEASLYRYTKELKEQLGAPLQYCSYRNSYYYECNFCIKTKIFLTLNF